MSQAFLPTVGDGFEHYMAQLNRFPLLSAEEDQQLARRYRDAGDLEAAHSLVCAKLRFVVRTLRRSRRKVRDD